MSMKELLFGKKQAQIAWPKDEQGQDRRPVFLTRLKEADLEGEIIIALLRSAEIPVKLQYPNGGSFGRVVMGFSGTGVELFVPENMSEDANALLAGEFEEEESTDV